MSNIETKMFLPPGWGDDPLSSFLANAFQNTLATFVNKKGGFGYNLLSTIDQHFLRIGENLNNPPDYIGAMLLLRSHSVFRAACRLALSGQVTDTFPSLRSCLEYSLYALHINKHADLGEVWLKRHEDDEAYRMVKKEFQHVAVMGTLNGQAPKLYSIIKALYERTIDFGAHPNQRAVTGSMSIDREPDRIELKQIYLHDDSTVLIHAIKTTAQIGLGSLCVFQLIFPERFAILGLRDVIDQLRQQL